MNKVRWHFSALTVLALALCGAPVAAQEGEDSELPGLTLEQAVRNALANHPGLRQAQVDVGSAQLRVKAAKAGNSLQVDAGGLGKRGLAGSANIFGLNGLAASPDPEGMAFSANFFQNILDFGRTKHETAARRAEVDFYLETLRAEEAGLILRVQEAYFASLAARARIKPAQDAVEEKELAARRAATQYRTQIGSRLDQSIAEAHLSQAQRDLALASEADRRAMAKLKTEMGENSAGDYILRAPEMEEGSVTDEQTLQTEAMRGRPEIAAVEARIRAGEHWVRRAERERYPKIMGLFSGGWTKFAELTLGRLLFGGFGIFLPVFTSGRITADIGEMRLALEKTRAAREELLQAVALQVTEAHVRSVAAVKTYRAAEDAVTVARATERLARARYEHKLADRLEWMAARTELSSSESDLSSALYTFEAAEAQLDFSVGRRTLLTEREKGNR